jgi:hypothetical protein
MQDGSSPGEKLSFECEPRSGDRNLAAMLAACPTSGSVAPSKGFLPVAMFTLGITAQGYAYVAPPALIIISVIRVCDDSSPNISQYQDGTSLAS